MSIQAATHTDALFLNLTCRSGTNWQGLQLAGGLCFVLDGVQADQDYCRLAFTLNKFFSKTECCAYCGATSGGGQSSEMLYTNFNPAALHRTTHIATLDEWIRVHGDSPLLTAPGFLPHARLFPDWMRITDLAIAPDLIGSLLLDVSDDSAVFAASTRDERLKMAFESYRKWCNQNNVQDRCMSRMFTTAILKPGISYPHISQRTMSGTASRFVIQWLAGLMRQVARVNPSAQRKRLFLSTVMREVWAVVFSC